MIAHMITWESLALEKNLPPTLSFSTRTIEARHQDMQVCSQRTHDSNFRLEGPDNRSHKLYSMVIDMEKRLQGGVGMLDKMASDTLRTPLSQKSVDKIRCSDGLKT